MKKSYLKVWLRPAMFNNNNIQDDIYYAVYMVPAIYESSLWIIWTTVGQRQVAANS